LLATRLDPAERVRGPVGLAGLSIGLGGLLLIFGVDIRGDSRELLGGLLVTAAALCYAVGSLLIHRRLAFAQPLGVASAAMVVAAIVVTAAALVMPGLLALPAGRPSIASTMALIALGTVFTALTLRLFYGLIADVGPARAALAFYLSPGVAVLLGWALLGETISPCIVLGLLAVVVGSALAARR
jgi:drug/metabolite transporter (DMT)-like permease